MLQRCQIRMARFALTSTPILATCHVNPISLSTEVNRCPGEGVRHRARRVVIVDVRAHARRPGIGRPGSGRRGPGLTRGVQSHSAVSANQSNFPLTPIPRLPERFVVTPVLTPVALYAGSAPKIVAMDRQTPTTPSDGLTRSADATAGARGFDVEVMVRREGESAERYVGTLPD